MFAQYITAFLTLLSVSLTTALPIPQVPLHKETERGLPLPHIPTGDLALLNGIMPHNGLAESIDSLQGDLGKQAGRLP
ncbi:hypothetical protein BDV06DRAFT_201997 [Aspergillus oleicola]